MKDSTYSLTKNGRLVIEKVKNAIEVLEDNNYRVSELQESEPYDMIVLRAVYDEESDPEQFDCLIISESDIEEGISLCIEAGLIKKDPIFTQLVVMDWNNTKVYVYKFDDIGIKSDSEAIEEWISEKSNHNLSEVDYMSCNNFEVINK